MADTPRLNGVIRALEQGSVAFVGFAPVDVETAVAMAGSKMDGVAFEMEHAPMSAPALRDAGCAVHMAIGAARASRLLDEGAVAASDSLTITTEDGSGGERGLVTDALQILGQLHGDGDEPKIAGQRCLGEEVDGHLIHIQFEAIQHLVVGFDGKREIKVAIDEGGDGVGQRLAPARDRIAELVAQRHVAGGDVARGERRVGQARGALDRDESALRVEVERDQIERGDLRSGRHRHGGAEQRELSAWRTRDAVSRRPLGHLAGGGPAEFEVEDAAGGRGAAPRVREDPPVFYLV